MFTSIQSSMPSLEKFLWPMTKSKMEDKISPENRKVMRKQMTSIGRFSLASQTKENPSVISFFVALAHEAGRDIDLDEFSDRWEQRVMKKHDRFGFRVSLDDERYFEVSLYIDKFLLSITSFQ